MYMLHLQSHSLGPLDPPSTCLVRSSPPRRRRRQSSTARPGPLSPARRARATRARKGPGPFAAADGRSGADALGAVRGRRGRSVSHARSVGAGEDTLLGIEAGRRFRVDESFHHLNRMTVFVHHCRSGFISSSVF